MKKLAYLLLLLTIPVLNGFTQSDLGVIWQKNDYTTIRSNFADIIPQEDGTYLAVGSIVQNNKNVGYIVNIDESGRIIENNQKGEYIFSPSDSWPEWNTGAPWSTIRQAFFTDDNHIIAFGEIFNTTCDLSLKGYSISGAPLAETQWLRKGFWVAKINRQTGAVVFNNLDRGSCVTSGAVYKSGKQFLLIGMDYFPENGVNYMGLIRLYNSDGTWLYDNYETPKGKRVSYSWAELKGKDASGNFYLSTNMNVVLLDKDDFSNKGVVVTYLTYTDNSCVLGPTAAVTHPLRWYPHAYFTAQPNGDFLITSRMSGLLVSTNPDVIRNYGFAYYKKNAANQLVFCTTTCDRDTPVEKFYYASYLLPGSSNQYVGRCNHISTGANYMYLYTDNGNTGTITDGAQFPYNTILSTTSHTDGFFSCGQDNNTGRAAIAKLSTCANFITPDTATIHIAMAPQVTVNKTFRYQGAKGASVSDVQYKLDIRVASGTVNGKTTGEILESIPFTNVQSYAASGGSASGNAFTLNRTYTVDTDTNAELELIFTLKDSYMTAGVSQQCNQSYIVKTRITKVSSTLFSDDVWFFGQNTGAREGNSELGNAFTSKGIIFYNDNGMIKAKDASGVAAVNSWENSLSVSTPACNGSFIFYTQHDTVYNSNHEPMKNGGFSGHTSCGDGLAAAYLGDNKYIFIAMSWYNRGDLNYYIIDMDKENGLGEMLPGGTIDVTNVGESIELMPVPGTYNQYWLVYYLLNPENKIVVKKIDGTDPLNPVFTDVSTLSISLPGNPWRMQANPDYTLIAINSSSVNAANACHHFLNFNATTGAISYNRSITTLIGTTASYASYVFYKNYLYIAESKASITNGYKIYQYDLNNNWAKVAEIAINDNTSSVNPGVNMSFQGGGMKMGPDGKIYFIRQSSKYTGVIHNPDLLLTAPGNVDENGFKHVDEFNNEYNGMGIAMSTGLTPPWIDPPSENTPPTTVVDIAEGYQYAPIVVSPLLNDSDIGGAANLNLTGAELVNPTDAAMGTLTWDAAAKTVTFTPDIYYDLQSETVIHISYIARNSGTPVGLCEEGRIEITLKPAKIASTLFSDDVWFFGNNVGVAEGNAVVEGNPQTSKAMVFKNEGGSMVPYDYSVLNGGKSSMVNSWENSLSVSTPACNGSFIFYTQHNKVFNANHEEMKNGTFAGHTSTADGLAAAYLGDNIYILLSVSSASSGHLNYYLVDMNKENGLGELLPGGTIVSDNVIAEGIELMPVPDTYNQYWLVYFRRDDKNVYVHKINGTNPYAPIISGVISKFDLSSYLGNTPNANFLFRLKSSADYSKLAFNFGVWNDTNANIQLLNFNPLNGSLSYDRQLVLERSNRPANGMLYADFVFYDKYLYVSNSDLYPPGFSRLYIHKIDLTDNSQKYIDFWTSPDTEWSGGGMKMGPDGKIYLIKQNNNYMAVINNPELDLDAPGNFDANGFELLYGGMGLALSTGLTPPWINPPSSNQTPVAVNDTVICTLPQTVTIRPLDNDSDPDNDLLFLTGVDFANPADAVKGSVTWNSTTKEVVFTPNSTYSFTNGETIYLNYILKDNGAPVALCDEGTIVIECYYPIAAANDYAVAFPCATTDINVLQNDLTSAGYSLSVTKQGNHGTAVFVGDVLQYTVSGNDCCDMGGLTDTVTYSLCVNNGLYCVQAIAVINILRCTDIVLQHNCSIAPQMILSHQYAGNYLWEYSDDNITWSPLPAYNDMPLCKELVPGFYRATVNYQGTTYVTPSKQLLQIKKIPVPGGMFWYEMELQ